MPDNNKSQDNKPQIALLVFGVPENCKKCKISGYDEYRDEYFCPLVYGWCPDEGNGISEKCPLVIIDREKLGTILDNFGIVLADAVSTGPR